MLSSVDLPPLIPIPVAGTSPPTTTVEATGALGGRSGKAGGHGGSAHTTAGASTVRPVQCGSMLANNFRLVLHSHARLVVWVVLVGQPNRRVVRVKIVVSGVWSDHAHHARRSGETSGRTGLDSPTTRAGGISSGATTIARGGTMACESTASRCSPVQPAISPVHWWILLKVLSKLAGTGEVLKAPAVCIRPK